ncbi:unnamed protein product [Allacma fusca]|uniref:Uncharacterized protein n=1 Tax=Allacma fusca TaxID=39272 RepID=A0A8J2K7J1_9HEXA|nr:unnamed protein product [Allacma fusca]
MDFLLQSPSFPEIFCPPSKKLVNLFREIRAYCGQKIRQHLFAKASDHSGGALPKVPWMYMISSGSL